MSGSEGKDAPVPVIGIGASAGGLEALREVFQAHKGASGMAFVVVQHLDPTHESLMAQLLERYTDMAVTQAAGGEEIAADHIYVIPPGNGLAISDGVLELTDFRDPRGMRRPIDDFFESLAEDRGNHAACVILSGTGGDGSRGLRAIKEHGGLAIVQEPASARYDGMPVSAISTGLVDVVARPGQVIEALTNFFNRADQLALSEEADETADHIDEMCATLQEAVGHDFTGYKRSTLSRRIARRMQVIGVATSAEYLAHLRNNPSECEALFRDLLINVTRFFRDQEEFAALDRLVIEPLVAASRAGSELRVWVAGCSSGEEAFSIAMLFAEAMRRHDKRFYLQIFATDIDDKILDIARGATYPLAALADIPPEMQGEYLQIGPDHFTIAPRIRDMVRFSVHNVVRDPPFSKIDLVSCRNLLIYFDEDLQRQVIPMFHFALKDDGKLFLGNSETIGRFDDLFHVADQRARIYDRRPAMGRYALNFGKGGRQAIRATRTNAEAVVANGSVEMVALKRIAERYAPVSLLVDNEGMLLDHWGATSRYLSFPDRLDHQVDVSRQAKPGLREILGALLRESAQSDSAKIARNVEVRTDFGLQKVTVLADPVGASAVLLVIREEGPLNPEGFDEFEEYQRGDGELRFLQDELQNTRQRLRTTVEELETTNEELKSSNEEMMSMNEELQSTNEELTTVNDELKAKVDQLTLANADLKNFFDSTELAVLVVDRQLHLRSFTDAAKSLFPLERNHVGAALAGLPSRLKNERYLTLARAAAQDGEVGEARLTTLDESQHFVLRAQPYRRFDGEVDGAILVMTDITPALELERELVEERARLRMALDVARIGVWEFEPSSGETRLDETERQLLGIDSVESGHSMDSILDRLPDEDRDKVNKALLRAMDGERDYDEVFRVNMPSGGQRWLHGLGRRLDLGDARKFVGVTYDVTAERELLAQRDLMIREMNHRVKNLFAIIASLVSMSARHSDNVADFASELRDRIHALGRSHALTADRSTGEASLADIIDTVVRPSANGQNLTIHGDPLVLPNRLVTPLALVFHEWATNSVKYGALSEEDGSLTVSWQHGDGRVLLSWEELGGSEKPNASAGFGTQMVDATVQQLAGTVSAAPKPGGFSRRLEFAYDS